MTDEPRNLPPLDATTVAPPKTSWIGFYPEQFRIDMSGVTARRLADAVGLKNFGVNMVTLQPGAVSAKRHWHETQDELVYVLSGTLTLVSNAGETLAGPGMVMGFQKGVADGHYLANRSDAPATYLAVGDRSSPERVTYSDDDLVLEAGPNAGPRGFRFQHKDGTPY